MANSSSFFHDLEAGVPLMTTSAFLASQSSLFQHVVGTTSSNSVAASWSGHSFNTCESKSISEQPLLTTPKSALLSSIKDIQLPEKPLAPFRMPSKTGPKWYRNARYLVFTTYRRLFSFAFFANLAAFIALLATNQLNMSNSATAAAVNLVVSILMRQEHVINVLFLISSCLPTSLPLFIRRNFAKIYCYGGLHSGCGIGAAFWFSVSTAYLTIMAKQEHAYWPAAGLAYAIVTLLILIVGFAYPTIRQKMHDNFEMTHRFAGWIVVAIYWAQLMVITNATRSLVPRSPPFSKLLIHSPPFWCIIIITVCLFYPWIRLRKRSVYVEKLSDHAARLHFNHTSLDRCLGVRLSTNPLFEAHSFATIPAAYPEVGFSCVVSNAGDWTKSIIQDPKTRTKIWTKGAPTYGVLRTALIFKRTVLVATGSGIGPCLSLLNGNDNIDCRVLWSTPAPETTYGDRIINAVLRTDPQAMIHDTRKHGRPDVGAMTYQLYKESGAEAVFVISNPRVTRKLIYQMESRGIPAFAPIFDS